MKMYTFFLNKKPSEGPTIVVKNNETNDKFYRKVAFPRYTESVKFMSQSRETALKLKPHRGLELGCHPRHSGHVTH